MLNRVISLVLISCVFTLSSSIVLGQTKTYKVEPFRQTTTLSRDKFNVKLSERSKELIEKDSFSKITEDSITTKTMQDADKIQQKKKRFVGMNTTTAIVVGAALAAVIIIVLANKGNEPRDPCIISPCP